MKGSRRRFEALDAWRGLCALIVALEHLSIANPIHRNALVHRGARFVDFFFVLSGFVIAHSYRDRLHDPGERRAFFVRRIGRLWPLHVVLLLVLIGFELALLVLGGMGRAAFTDRNTLATIPLNALLMHSWGFLGHLTWNTPSWSISTEILAYAFFALLCMIANAWSPRRSRELTILLAAVVAVTSVAVVGSVAPLGMGSTFDFGLVRCFYGFMTGVLVRALWDRVQPRIGTFGEIAVLALVVVATMSLPNGWPAVAMTPVFALAVWVFASEDGALSRLMKRGALQALGAWSYSIYMVHAVILFAMLMVATLATKHGFHVFARVDNIATIVGPLWFTTAFVLAYVGLVLATARTTYRYIELPGQRVFGRWAYAERRVSATT